MTPPLFALKRKIITMKTKTLNKFFPPKDMAEIKHETAAIQQLDST